MRQIGQITAIEPCIQGGHLRMKVLFDSRVYVVVSINCLERPSTFMAHVLRKLGCWYNPTVLQYSPGGGGPTNEVPVAHWLAAIAAKIVPATGVLLDEDPDDEYGYSVEL